jgi:hypothetical protein
MKRGSTYINSTTWNPEHGTCNMELANCNLQPETVKSIKVQIESIDYSLWLKKDLTTENHKPCLPAGREDTENTKRNKMKNMNLNSVALCETSVYSVVKEIGKREARSGKLEESKK